MVHAYQCRLYPNKEQERMLYIRNQRNDVQHKVSRHCVDNYDLIVTEALRPTDMVRDGRLTRSIADASWSSLNQKLAYKAENAGKLFVQ